MNFTHYTKTTITVEGKTPFPLRMLVHDTCTPAQQVDVNTIADTFSANDPAAERLASGERYSYSVKLHRYSFDGSRADATTWKATGWTVVEDNGRK